MQIKINNIEHAGKCVQWLMENVGPQIPGQVGTVVRGEGWKFWCRLADLSEWEVTVELTDDVDEETATMFMLKWS